MLSQQTYKLHVSQNALINNLLKRTSCCWRRNKAIS